MRRARPAVLLFSGLAFVLLGWSPAWGQDAPLPDDGTPARRLTPTVEEARRQAVLLHATIHSSLQLIHDQYYREDEGLPIPAAMLKGVFRDLERDEQVKLRWLAVEGQAMNSDHKPQDSFELEAVKLLRLKHDSHEQVADGIYRRAAPIRLTNHCLKCHVPDRRSTRDRTAGLIIQMPVRAR